MLKWRLLTAAVLVPAFVWSVLALPTSKLAWVFAVVVLGAAWEWARFIPLTSVPGRLAYPAAICVLIVLAHPVAGAGSGSVAWLLPVVACWLLLFLWLVTPDLGREPSIVSKTVKLVTGGVVLVPTWMALIAIHGSGPNGPVLLLTLMALIWAADSGAYFAGRKWGRRKLAPRVSPGKTWEGVFGGVICSAIAACAGAWYLEWQPAAVLLFVAVAVVTAAFSVAGDLFESLMKRHQALKDSGHILPGHGGIMDRIDSLTAAGPVYLAGLALLGLPEG